MSCRGSEKGDRRVSIEQELRRRFRALFVGVAILIAVVLGGIYVYRLAMLKPGSSVDYAQLLFDRVAKNQPQDEDAWPEYEALHKAHESIVEAIRAKAPELEGFVHPDYTSIVADPPEPPTPTGDAELDALNAESARAAIKEQQVAQEWARAALDRFPQDGIDARLDALVAAKTVIRPKSDAVALLARLMPDLGDSRGLARALRSRMRLSAERGDIQSIAKDFERMLALGRHIGNQGLLIERLVGIAIASLAMAEVREQLARETVTPEVCQALLAAIDRQVRLPPPSFHVEGERLQILDTLQMMHSDDGHGDGIRIVTVSREMGGQAPGPRIVNVLGLFEPSKKQMFAAANSIFDGLSKSSDVPRRSGRKSVFDYEAHVSKLGPKYKLLKVFGGAYDKAFAANDQFQLELAGTRVLVAVRLFELEKKRPPSSLDELVPRYLAVLPDDPYAPDGRLRWKSMKEPDDQGRRYILYSVGADGVDDGGTPAASRFDALRDELGEGTDFVINASDK